MTLDEALRREYPAEREQMPHNIEVEQALLGAIFINNDVYALVQPIVTDEHFYEPLHQKIYEIVGNLINVGSRATPIVVKEYLPADVDIAGMNPAQYLARLAAEATSIINAVDYAKTIADLSTRRHLIGVLRDAIAGARQIEVPVNEVIADVQGGVSESLHGTSDDIVRAVPAIATRVLDGAAEAYKNPAQVPGFDTGINGLDEILGRIMPGDLGFIGGSQGHGKTVLLTQLLKRASLRGPAVLFEMEMTGEDVVRRLVAAETEMSVSQIEEGAFDAWEYEKLHDARQRLPPNFFIVDRPRLRVSQIRAHCMALKRTRGLAMVGIDHLRLTQADVKVRDIFERTEYVTGTLKQLAKELKVPFVVLAQRTRTSQGREDPAPQITDFWGGGSIEQDADWVIGTWRRELWLRQRRPPDTDQDAVGKWMVELNKYEGILEMICLKRRRGKELEQRRFKFEGKTTTITDV